MQGLIFFVLSFLSPWITLTIGISPVIFTENGFNFSGSHCPGIVNVHCEGRELAFLRWRFNEEVDIQTYTPDSNINESTQLSDNPAFISVELVDVSVSQVNARFFNFTSILSVNISQLQEQNITKIECGDSIDSAIERVNVAIIQQSPPDDPVITNVSSTFSGSGLDEVTVNWMKVPIRCPVYGSMLYYQAALIGDVNVSVQVPHEECEESYCSAVLDIPQTGSSATPSGYGLTLIAINPAGSSNLLSPIGAFNGSTYLHISFAFNNCTTNVLCTSPLNLGENTLCKFQHTEDGTHLSNLIEVPFGVYFPTSIVETKEVYYLASVSVNEVFEVIIQGVVPRSKPVVPEITQAVVSYSGDLLTQVEITWMKELEQLCINRVTYEATIHGLDGVNNQTVAHLEPNDCDISGKCLKVLNVSSFLSQITEFRIGLSARLLDRTFTLVQQDIIYAQSSSYYEPTLTVVNCQTLYAHCSESITLEGSSEHDCILRYYGNDQNHQRLVSTTTIKINRGIEVVQLEDVSRHFFKVYMNVSSVLQIVDYILLKADNCMTEGESLSIGAVIGVVAGVITLFSSFFVMTALGYCAYAYTTSKKLKAQNNDAPPVTSTMSESPSPIYDEPSNVPKQRNFELKKNEAYSQFELNARISSENDSQRVSIRISNYEVSSEYEIMTPAQN